MSNYSEFHSSGPTVKAANGRILHIEGAGTLASGPFTITDVYCCPSVSMNLLSVSKLTDLGYRFLFTAQTVTITYPSTNKVILVGQRTNGIYHCNLHVEYPLQALSVRVYTSSDLTTLAHRRMGHLNYLSLRRLS